MGRPKKNVEKIDKRENSEELLTEKEVWDVIEFAKSMGGSGYLNVLTPFLINQRMKDISLNPMQATEDNLATAMKTPKDSELALQSFSQDFEIQSQPYRRLLSYLGNMLSFDLTWECTNAKASDYKSPSFLKDLDVVKDFLDRFDYKQEFTTVVGELLRNEAYFSCARFDNDKIVLQELPASPLYTMITGRWSYGLLYSLNMYWFLLPGVDLDMYPDFFKDKYALVMSGKQGLLNYDPGLSPTNDRGNSSWVYWQDIPVGKDPYGWCFKMNPAIATRVPYFSGLFLDLVQQALVRQLQKNVNMAVANRMLMGQVGKIKDSTSKQMDKFDISPGTLGKYLAMVKAAIGESMNIISAPLENMDTVAFPEVNDLYSSYLKTALATSGVNTNLIFTSDVRPNAIESQLSLNVDEQLMLSLYPQFANFLNYHVNRNTKYFKFYFTFEGTSFFNNRQQRIDNILKLANLGMVFPQKIAAAYGIKPSTFIRMMEESKGNNFVDLLTPIVSAFQQSGGGGRPQKSAGELSDSGEETRASGSNIEKGGKI